ncbi:hypothetical protein GF323_00305 [Candidatus Woesearchaeota archaeon]|nr:hypothetical protein [Candidatus Woesearchaeota archaeon]
MAVIPWITLFIISVFLIIIGLLLTISIIFIPIGLPLLIIGIILIIISVFLFISGSVETISSLLKPKNRVKIKIAARKEKKPKKRPKIIDVKEQQGIYEVK